MPRYFRARLGVLSLFLLPAGLPASAQTPDSTMAPLHEVHADGEKVLSEAQVVAITGLMPGALVGRNDLQTGADKLVQSGLFAKVSYNFQTRFAGVLVTRSEEHTSELQSRLHLVCRLLLEKKKKKKDIIQNVKRIRIIDA